MIYIKMEGQDVALGNKELNISLIRRWVGCNIKKKKKNEGAVGWSRVKKFIFNGIPTDHHL